MNKHIDELKALAQKGTQEEWCTDSRHGVIADSGLNANYYIASCSGPDCRANAEFIAAASPTVILGLLAKLEAAEKEIGDWRSIAEASAQDDADWHKLADSKNEVISQLAQGIIKLKERVEQNVKTLNRVVRQRDKAFADIAAAEARLLVPVKLPSERFQYHESDYDDGHTVGWNSYRLEAIKEVTAAGYPVEGGE